MYEDLSNQIHTVDAASHDHTVSLLANVVFTTAQDNPLHLHLLIPNGYQQPLPLICWIQGSAFGAYGPQDTLLRIPELVQFAKGGYVVASIEHRVCHEAVFPAQIHDVKSAVCFLKENADKFQIDPKRVGAWGNYSGGYLATFLGTSSHVRDFNGEGDYDVESTSIQAVVDWYGPTDFLQMSKYPSIIDHDASNSPESLFIGYPIQDNPHLVEQANPLTYITDNTPPFLIMHGDQDDYVPLNQSELLFEALSNRGHKPLMYRVRGAGHGTGFGEEQFNMVKDFFDLHL